MAERHTARVPAGRPVLSLALASMMEEVHAHSGAVYLLNPAEPVLEMAVAAGLPRQFSAPWERVGLGAPIPVAEAARYRRLVWVGDEGQMARLYPRIAVVLPYPFSMAALPVATPATLFGAVFLTWPGGHPPELSPHERGHLTAACHRLALRLERAVAQGRPLHAEPDLVGAPAVGMAGAPASVEAVRMAARLPYGMLSLDLHGRIGFANPAAVELLGVPAGTLLGTKPWASVPWLNDPVYEDRYRAALLSQHITSFMALRPPATWLSFRMYPDTTGLSVRVSRARPAAPPGGRSAQAHGGGGAGTGLVTISQILSLAGALTRAAGVQDVVQLVADEIVPAVGGRAIAVLGARAGRMHVLGHRGFTDTQAVRQYDGMPLTAQTPGAQALTKGVPAFFDSRAELTRLYPALPVLPEGLAAWAYLPLIASGRPVGTCVLAYAEPRTFSAEERAVLTSLGGLIAQALERAQLYDAKHRLAHGLQRALLPESLPSLAGFRTAARYLPATQGMDIGGDFYDLVPSRPLSAAVIGDVQGHNVQAAGLMGQIRTAVRAYTTVGQEPEEVMRSTNQLLIDLGSELFASCLYLRLDPAHGRAVMARAGHPPPLLLCPDGRVRVLELAGGPPLGITPTARYPATEIELAPGSLLALYTDGLVESPGADIEEALLDLGERLAEVGDRPLEAVADHLVRHSTAAQDRIDDVALLLLRAEGT